MSEPPKPTPAPQSEPAPPAEEPKLHLLRIVNQAGVGAKVERVEATPDPSRFENNPVKYMYGEPGTPPIEIKRYVHDESQMRAAEPETTAPGPEGQGDIPATQMGEQPLAQPRDGKKTKGMPWREALERSERRCLQGGPFPGQKMLAEQIGCSPGLINKALNSPNASDEIKTWAKLEKTSAPRARSFTVVDIDEFAQSREPDPVDDAARNELTAAIDAANPDMKAFLHLLKSKAPMFLTWLLKQGEKVRAKCQRAFQKFFGDDPTSQHQFFQMSLEGQIAALNDPDPEPDPGKPNKIRGRKA